MYVLLAIHMSLWPALYIYIIYTVMFVNDSPRLEGNSVTAEFTISRAANLIECGITGRERVDCEYIHVYTSHLCVGVGGSIMCCLYVQSMKATKVYNIIKL